MPYGGMDGRDALRENRGVETVTKKVRYTDRSNNVEVGQLWAGDILLEVVVAITENFNGSGTDLLTVGDKDTAGKYLASASVASTGKIIASQAGTPLVPAVPETADTPIYAKYLDQNSNATTGTLTVTTVIARCVAP